MTPIEATLRNPISRLLLLLVLPAAVVGGCGSDNDGADDSSDVADAGGADTGGEDDGAPAATGTAWLDETSGLTWQVLGEYPEMSWADGLAHCEALVLAGFEDWRSPTISDLRTLIRGCAGTQADGACALTDECTGAGDTCYGGDDCFGCMSGMGPGEAGCFWPTEMGAACGWTWSSSPADDIDGYPCYADFSNGHLSHDREESVVGHHVLCVR